MPQYDLAGNPLPEDASAPPPAAAQYDLAGNPIQAPPSPVAGQTLSPGQGASTAYGQPYGTPPPVLNTGPQPVQKAPLTYFDGKTVRFTNEPQATSAERLTDWLVGLGLALLVGIAGSIGIMKLVFFAGGFRVVSGFALLYMLVGAGVGAGIRHGAKKGGILPAAIAVAVLAFCLLIGHLTFTADMIKAHPDSFSGATVFSAFPAVLSSLTFFHWAGVLGSLFLCARIAFFESD